MTSRLARNGLIGEDAPLAAQERANAPDKREVSVRWLLGSTLTGVTSIALMGTALFVALDGKQFLATPPELASLEDAISDGDGASSTKSSRLVLIGMGEPIAASDRRRMSVSTITRVGDTDVVRTKPFEHLSIALAADNRAQTAYPPFDPLNIFAEGEAEAAAQAPSGSIIYGANVETEASIRVVDFAADASFADDAFVLSDAEAEEIVRETAAILTDGTIEIASLAYVDPVRFGIDDAALGVLDLPATARIVPQNISVAPMDVDMTGSVGFDEMAIPASTETPIASLLEQTGSDGALGMARALATLLNTETLKEDHTIRLGLQIEGEEQSIVRASVYDDREHVLTIALNDQDQYVPAPEPADPGVMRAADEELEPEIALLAERDLPTAYDAIYRGVLSYDLPEEKAAQIIRMVAADVDFRSRIKPTDELELFYSIPEEGEETSEGALLYVSAHFGGNTRQFYRFTDSNGATDYYDSEGRSARQFLLRNPVPNGKFRSGFGMRRHPILKYSRMHWGVDWSAPRGTPIIAPGNGVVQKAGWSSGYGKQTVIRHANGYETSYSHQTRFANGIQPGARVRQGQVIGYIGSTGLSTGPHLHYEMKVNGKRVDPMRVRLPKGKTLTDADLAAFKRERDRIDALVNEDSLGQEVASAEG